MYACETTLSGSARNIGAICLRMRVFWCLMMQNGGFRRNYDVLDFNEIHQCFFFSDFSSIIWK